MRVALVLLAAVSLTPALSAQSSSRNDYTPTARVVAGPEPGREAPSFTLPWATKDTTSVADYGYDLRSDRGKVVVLAFYPKDFTNSSSAQFQSFTERRAELFGPDVVVLGISPDPIDTHRRFAASLSLPFRLLSDPNQRVAGKYGSKSRDGAPVRTVYVIGRDGKVTYRDLRFDPGNSKSLDRLKLAVEAATHG